MPVMQPIGQIRTPWAEKFGVPRQPGLADVPCVLELRGPWAVADAVRGLKAASHLWLIFWFDQVPAGQWAPTVRPPRLGGNQRVGVFASRSPFRPNPLGLSCVAWDGVWHAVDGGLDLELRGADLVDGTPVLDLKPVIPYADCPPKARHAWAGEAPSASAGSVIWSAEARAGLTGHPQPLAMEKVVEQTLGCDPRPAFHAVGREYHLGLADGWQVSFCANPAPEPAENAAHVSDFGLPRVTFTVTRLRPPATE